MKIHACWNQIGTWGNRTCPELKAAVHCRNCPTYSHSAAELLDRELPEGYLQTAPPAPAAAPREESRRSGSAVIFRIGREWLALATDVFKEVGELRAIHSLPHQRNGVVLGVANVRGELLVCVSLAALLGIAQTAVSAGSDSRARERLLVVGGRDGERLVFRVDEVHGIHRFEQSEIREAPATVSRAVSTYTRAMLPWREHSVGLLDGDLLFTSLNRSLS